MVLYWRRCVHLLALDNRMRLLTYIGGDIVAYTSARVGASKIIESSAMEDDYVRKLYALSKTGQMQQKSQVPQGS